jgi:hypothetical protein
LNFQKQKTEDHIMRLLILAAAATLVITGTAMADESVQSNVKGAPHHHSRDTNASAQYRDTNASIPGGSGPVDPNAHAMRMKNLHDSGYNPAGDVDAKGNIKQQN